MKYLGKCPQKDTLSWHSKAVLEVLDFGGGIHSLSDLVKIFL